LVLNTAYNKQEIIVENVETKTIIYHEENLDLIVNHAL